MTKKRVVALTCVFALLLLPAIAWAHAHLKRSQPASGSRVAAPQVINLWFSERPEVKLTGLTLKDATGRDFSLGAPQPSSSDPLEVSFAVSGTLPTGKYTVAW